MKYTVCRRSEWRSLERAQSQSSQIKNAFFRALTCVCVSVCLYLCVLLLKRKATDFTAPGGRCRLSPFIRWLGWLPIELAAIPYTYTKTHYVLLLSAYYYYYYYHLYSLLPLEQDKLASSGFSLTNNEQRCLWESIVRANHLPPVALLLSNMKNCKHGMSENFCCRCFSWQDHHWILLLNLLSCYPHANA